MALSKFYVEYIDITGAPQKRVLMALSPGSAQKLVAADPSCKSVLNSGYYTEPQDHSDGGAGSWALIGLMVALCGVVWAAPWSTMVIGGAIGTKLSEFITNKDTEDIIDAGKFPLTLFLLLTLGLGGFGFVGGKNMKDYVFNEMYNPGQVQKEVTR